MDGAGLFRSRALFLMGLGCLLILSACASTQQGHFYRPYAGKGNRQYEVNGIASWYGRPFHGRLTASGERYNMNQLTAAHKTLPFGAVIRVTNLANGRQVIVKINDRGPFIAGREIDLSRAAAEALAFRNEGTAPVHLEWIEDPSNHPNLQVPPHHKPSIEPTYDVRVAEADPDTGDVDAEKAPISDPIATMIAQNKAKREDDFWLDVTD